ncbi:D-aminopeptidase [uncultured archaeon]|nr:D-aminopeptidase [uncultured archaeon]
MRMCIKYVTSILVILVLAQLESTPVNAQQNESLDSTELGAFFDGVMASQLDAYHVPGATVSVVQNGKLIFARGYGYANTGQRTPVVADRILFRPGSVSKLFVWTAVMQLVEQGKLDLNADINTYLTDFKIPPTYPQPITLSNLMTHTPGFEEQGLGTFVRNDQDLKPLGEYLATHMPARMRPPGELTAYSNYGASLAGYIVSQVSGMPFDQYVEENIFKLLEMHHSTFRQPLPPDLAPDMAVGYTYVNGTYQPHDFEWVQSEPAGAMTTTATDLASFMIAHLQNGRFENISILNEATAQEMHQQSFTNDPHVNGFAHGFMVATINNQHIIWHGGDTFYFHSALVLIPEHNVGFFVSYNGATGSLAVQNTIRAFMDHYFPAPQPALSISADNVTRYAGAYLPARSGYSTPEKALGLFQSITVVPEGMQHLEVSLGLPSQMVLHYVEVEPSVFRSADVPPSIFGDLVFRADDQGSIKYMFWQNNPTTAYIKSPWYAEPQFNLILPSICILLFLSVIIWAPIGFWIKRHFREERPYLVRLASLCSNALSALGMAFMIGFIVLFSNPETALGLPSWAQYLFLLPWIIAVLAIGMVFFTILIWMRCYLSIPGRIHYTLVMLAALAFVWWLAYWNLL